MLTLPTREAGASSPQRFDGFNVITMPGHPYGSRSSRQALVAARRVGAGTIAIVPFLWQRTRDTPRIGRGDDMSDEELRSGIREARALGFTVIVKPHVWVPESWAGAIAPRSEPDWQSWFAGYRAALVQIARIAAEEQAEALVIGTELKLTTQRHEWSDTIAALRQAFPRTLTYVAHNVEEAEAIPFWPQLDAIGVSLYPALGADRDRGGRIGTMTATARRLDALGERTGKRILVGEIGLRSAAGATAKPWESAEERTAAADPLLQAEVLGDWLTVLRRPTIGGVLIWRWFTSWRADRHRFHGTGKACGRCLAVRLEHRLPAAVDASFGHGSSALSSAQTGDPVNTGPVATTGRSAAACARASGGWTRVRGITQARVSNSKSRLLAAPVPAAL